MKNINRCSTGAAAHSTRLPLTSTTSTKDCNKSSFECQCGLGVTLTIKRAIPLCEGACYHLAHWEYRERRMSVVGYRHILCAVDFTPHSIAVGAESVDLARSYGAELSFVHVIEYSPFALDNEVLMLPDSDVGARLAARAGSTLEEFAERVGAPKARRKILVGATKLELLRVARECQADLIVVGSHGRHGLTRILGSTASAA